MEIARHKETQLQPLFPLHSRGYISRSRIPLLPFDFPASCVHPRIHEAVRVPVGKGLKVDEPKLFTWTDLARTNNGSGIQSCIHRVYIHRAMAVDRRKARTLWNEIFFSFHSLSLLLVWEREREHRVEACRWWIVNAPLNVRQIWLAAFKNENEDVIDRRRWPNNRKRTWLRRGFHGQHPGLFPANRSENSSNQRNWNVYFFFPVEITCSFNSVEWKLSTIISNCLIN